MAGRLTLTDSKLNSGPKPVHAVHPTGNAIYVLDSGVIAIYTVNFATRSLTLVRKTVAGEGTPSVDLCITADGKYLYGISKVSLFSFSINQTTYDLTSIDKKIGIAATGLRFVTTVANKFLYYTHSFNGKVTLYSIDQVTGVPTFVTDFLNVVVDPMSLIPHPNNLFLFVADNDPALRRIITFSVDQINGFIANVSDSQAGITPSYNTMDPLGRFFYSYAVNTWRFWIYTINPVSGVLSQTGYYVMPGPPIDYVYSCMCEASGTYLFAGCAAKIYSLLMDQVLGSLSFVGTDVAANIQYLSTDKQGYFLYASDDTDPANGTIRMYLIQQASPQLVSTSTTSPTTVTATYNKEVKHINSANADDALNAANYVLSSGSGVPRTVLSVSLVSTTPTVVSLLLDGELTNGVTYTCVVSNVEDLVGDVIDPLHNSATFVGTSALPQVSSASATLVNKVRLLFDKAMDNNADLINPANYIFTGPTPLTAFSVTRIDATTVDITVVEYMNNGGSYTVTVSNVRDEAWNVIDPLHNSATFLGLGTLPGVSSGSALTIDTVRITYDKAMKNDADLIDPTHYIFTGPTVLSASLVTRIDSVTVDITVLEEMQNGGSYTVTVSSVKDEADNVIDPLHNSATFLGLGTLPRVSSGVALAFHTIEVIFTKAMKNDADLTNPANYIFTGPTSLTASLVVRIDSTTVDITVIGDMKPNLLYTVTVSNVKDLVDNVIDPLHNSATFLGLGVNFIAEILIGDQIVWSAENAIDQQVISIDTSAYYGIFPLKFRIRMKS